MLSRIAESLFWIGRYVERADGTARIVDSVRLTMLEDRADSAQAASRALSVLLGEPPNDQSISYSQVAHQLVFDAYNPSSIGGSWYAARENARRAREMLPMELWEALNAGWVRWRGFGRRDDAALPLHWTRDRSALIGGLADTTMSHDDAYAFMLLGRYLERADMTTRIILAGTQHGRPMWWTATLASAGGQQAYLRGHRGVMDDQKVATFLMLDRHFPRSILFSLQRAENYLARLAPQTESVGVRDEARRVLGRIRSQMEFEATVEVATLPVRLVEVQEAVSAAAASVARQYFPVASTPIWQGEGR